MTAPTCKLGEYGVALLKNGVKISTGKAKLSRIEYGRKLDQISSAKIDLITAGENCCGQLRRLTGKWNCELVITAANELNQDEVVWRGPILRPTFRKGSVTIEARDILKWLERRLIEQDFNFVDTDVSDIFIALATYAYGKDAVNPVKHEFMRFDSSTIEDRVVEAASQRMTWNVVSEMLSAGLDVTAYGSRIIVGSPDFAPFNLTDKQVLGDVEVYEDGDDYADRVIANASRDIIGIYPPGPPAPVAGLPLVEAQVVDSQISDQQSAQNAAKARYDAFAVSATRVRASGGLQLLPSSKINPRTLIAGQLINFAATETCRTARETLRVGSVTVVVEKGSETATIELQPLGEVSEAVA